MSGKIIGELTILITLFLLSVPALLVKKFSLDKKIKRPWWNFGHYNFLALAFLLLLSSITFILLFNPETKPETPDEEIDFGQRRGIGWYVQSGYEHKLQAEPTNLLYHFKALESRSKNVYSGRVIPDNIFFDKTVAPEYYYEGLTKSANKDIRDAGHFGTAAMILIRDGSLLTAEEELNAISDQNKAVVQYARALLCEKKEEGPWLKHLQQEIKNKGNVKDAVEKLAGYYYFSATRSQLINLNTDSLTGKYVDDEFKKILAFENNHFAEFLRYDLSQLKNYWNLPGILASIFIFCIWLFYILKIDLHEKEHKIHLVSIIILSAVFTLLSGYYYHWLHYTVDLHEGNSHLTRFFYYIFGVGLGEEIIKLIPVLIILRFTKAINEPMDYIVFGSLSALTFAMVENTMYFDEDSVFNIHTRMLWTSVNHAALTCITTYFMMLPKWKPGFRRKWRTGFTLGLTGLIIASVTHGLYDFFLHKDFSEIWIVPFMIVIMETVMLSSMINNCLNNSPFFNRAAQLNTEKLGSTLAGLLLLVIVFEFFCMSFIYGGESGLLLLVHSLMYSWYLLFFLAVRLSAIDILQGQWERIRLFADMNPVSFILLRKINYARYLGQEITLSAANKNSALRDLFPCKGKITSRMLIENEKHWLVVDIEKPLRTSKAEYSQVIVRTVEKAVPLISGLKTEVFVYVLPQKYAESTTPLTEKNLLKIDVASVS